MTTTPPSTDRPPEVRTPCSQPNSCEDGDLCATHEEEQAHAEGEHAFCGPTCEVEEYPSDAPCTATLREDPMADRVHCQESGYHGRHTSGGGSEYYTWLDGDEGAGTDGDR